MVEKLDIIVRQGRQPELFDFLIASKKQGLSYIEALIAILEENKRLNQEVVKQNDWTGMRLALRATEKNSHLTIELLNNLMLARPTSPILTIEEKSPNLVKAERDWKGYIEELQAERSTKKAIKTGKGSPLSMPDFEFGEEERSW